MAEKCDKEGQRTLGVLTKPDLVDRGAENRVVDLVEGKSPITTLCGQDTQDVNVQQVGATNSSSAGQWSEIPANRTWKIPHSIDTPLRKISSKAKNLGPDSRETALALSLFKDSSAIY